jgi:diguanylate cyclase (GGDEF)-like protein
MPYALYPNAALHFVIAGMALAFSLVALPIGRKEAKRGAVRLLGAFSLALGLWSLTAGIAAANLAAEGKFFWTPISFFFGQIAVFVFLCFSRSFTLPQRRIARAQVVLLAIPAALLLIALAANPLHRLLWTGYSAGSAGRIEIPLIRGPLFFCIPLINFAYSAASAILFLTAAFRSRGRFRLHCFSILAALCLAWLASFASLLEVPPLSGTDIAPLGFLILDAILVWLFYRGGFGEAFPIARDWVIDQMADPFIVLDSRNAILDANRAARGLLGIAEDGVGKRAALEEPWKSALDETSTGAQPRVVTVEEAAGGNAEKRWYELIRQGIDLGAGHGRVILIHDVTDIASQGRQLRETINKLDRRYGRAKANEKEMRELAIRDGLTSLFNRRYLEDILPEIVAGAGLASRKLSLAMIDMDHFKAVNDSYGHDAGDLVLKGFADFISGVIRSTDVAARFGGEEFVIVFPQLGGDAALRKIESLLAAFSEKSFRAGTKSFRMTFSAGIAELASGRDSAESLVKRADLAMYQAKGSGRNKAVLAGRK